MAEKMDKINEEILHILFQPERAFYIGIIILISVIVYFMDVSSN